MKRDAVVCSLTPGTGGVTKPKGQAKRSAITARKAALLKAATPSGACVKKPHSHTDTAAASAGAYNSFKVKRITPRHL
ncbi:hypothetical protein QJQ45_010487 [Haematococcus lacustris]|nr:hypothetical protein QJQ45_010487 [Haematococcus lacustris]